MGAGSSYMGCIRVNTDRDSESSSTTPKAVKSKTFSAGYADVKDKIVAKDYMLGYRIGLDEYSTRIGILHNKILDGIDNIIEQGNEDILLEKLSSEEKALVNSTEFITTFDKIVNTSDQSAYTYTLVAQPKSAYILQLFEEALELSYMDEEIIENIITEYVAIVKKNNELSQKEKDCLYVAFAVAWYSYHYWENWNLTHRYVD